ncbi:glycosyltransferase family 2 protein [Patescibacteria group bacterium]
MNNPKLSIIIASWNVRDLLRQCLQSIYIETKISFEIIVVDNASRDDSADMVAKNFPQVKLIRNKTNRGFGAANNQGIKIAKGEFVIFLNDDTKITDHALDKMVAFLEKTPEAGIAGARLLNTDHTLQIGTARQFPTFKILVTMLLGLHSFLLKKPWLKKFYLVDERFKSTREVDQVMGASLMTRRSIIEKTGAFDEKFWIWFEEVDLCKRVHDSGYKIFVVSNAEIVHHKGKSFEHHVKIKKFFYLSGSMFVYAAKHLLPWQSFLLYLLWPFGFLIALIVQVTGIKSSSTT